MYDTEKEKESTVMCESLERKFSCQIYLRHIHIIVGKSSSSSLTYERTSHTKKQIAEWLNITAVTSNFSTKNRIPASYLLHAPWQRDQPVLNVQIQAIQIQNFSWTTNILVAETQSTKLRRQNCSWIEPSPLQFLLQKPKAQNQETQIPIQRAPLSFECEICNGHSATIPH